MVNEASRLCVTFYANKDINIFNLTFETIKLTSLSSGVFDLDDPHHPHIGGPGLISCTTLGGLTDGGMTHLDVSTGTDNASIGGLDGCI